MVKERSFLFKERTINSPKDVVKIVCDFVEGSDREKFIVIHLNTKNQPNCLEVISIGSLNISIVHPREVMKGVILSNSNGMILVHNHPSGNLSPSEQDRRLTERLVKTGRDLDLPVLDHVIFGDRGYFSFADEGLL